MIFSFDTEDYVDPVSNDALLKLAQTHTRYGVPACFGIVGEKARFLQACGRRDVIEAVARHEVGYHSDHHFMQPDPAYEQEYVPEYVEKQPWDRAVARLLAEESRGVHDVAEIFDRQPVTWLRTYGDWAPQYVYTFSRLGVPIYAYGPRFHGQDCAPIWYCNQLAVANPRLMYENNLHREDLTAREKLEAHKQNLLNHLESGTPRLGFVTHPTRFISDTWWEEPNWWKGIIPSPPRARWTPPPRFSPEKIDALLWIADEFVKFVSELDGVECVTFSDFLEPFKIRRRWLTRAELKRAAAGLKDRPAYQRLGRETFSPAELLAALVFALSEPGAPEVPLRRILGPAEEPVDTPQGLRVSRQDVVDACREVEFFIRDRNRVPSAIRTGGSLVGPGGFLLALARAIQTPDSETFEIPPADNLPEPLHPDDYEQLSRGNPASYVQKQGEFDFPNTRRMGQLQYWTVKPA